MWRRPECPRFTLPEAVFLKRLAAPLCGFNFGIVPRNHLPAAAWQPSALDIQLLCSIALESLARFAPGESLSLRNRIRNFGCGGGRRRLLFFFWHKLFGLRLI